MDVFNLQAKIGLDTASFKNALSGAVSTGVAKLGDFARQGARYLADFAKDSVATGMQFDSSMAQVAATMGSTVDEIQELRDYAREMGATTAFSASQAADALNYMALAGYDAEQSMAMLPNVLNLAAAGSMELATASDMVTDAQSALGLTAEETTALVDKMATAASNSNTSVSQLGSAILTVGGTAKNLKGGTTELATVLGILADNGIKGAEGGTALRNMLNTLAAPTGDAANTLEQLGVQVYDTEGNMRSLNDVFGDMKNGLDQLTQQERMQAISNIFNVRDTKSAEAILGSVGDRYVELSGAIDNAAGAAAKMAETQLDTLAGDKTKFQSAFEGIKISVSDALTPTLREGVQFGTKWIERISKGVERGDPKAVTRAVMHMLKWGIKDIGSMAKEVIPEAASILAEDVVKPIGEEIVTNLPKLRKAGLKIVSNLSSSIKENLPTLIPEGISTVVEFAKGITDPSNTGTLIDAAFDIIDGLIEGFTSEDTINAIVEGAPVIVENLVDGIVKAGDRLADAALSICESLIDYFGEEENREKLKDASDKILTSLIDGFASLLAEGGKFAYKLGGMIAEQLGLGDYWKVGNDVLSEWWDGFKEKWEEFKGWFGDEIQLTLNPVKLGEQVGEKVTNVVVEGVKGGKAKRSTSHKRNAKGGIFYGPTYDRFGDLYGEAGTEMLLPLDTNTSWMDKFANKLTSRMGAGDRYYTINVYADSLNNDADFEKLVDKIDERLGEKHIREYRAIGGTGYSG